MIRYRTELSIAAWLVASSVVLAWDASPFLAAENTPAASPYLDDRSDAASLVRSLYNAIDRHEYVRAWDYFRGDADRPTFETFAQGYANTATVDVRTGEPTSEGAAGSIYYSVPVAVRSVATDGKVVIYTGCYELRMVQPGMQSEPPFQPLGIVKGKLKPAENGFDIAMGTCPVGGL